MRNLDLMKEDEVIGLKGEVELDFVIEMVLYTPGLIEREIVVREVDWKRVDELVELVLHTFE